MRKRGGRDRRSGAPGWLASAALLVATAACRTSGRYEPAAAAPSDRNALNDLMPVPRGAREKAPWPYSGIPEEWWPFSVRAQYAEGWGKGQPAGIHGPAGGAAGFGAPKQRQLSLADHLLLSPLPFGGNDGLQGAVLLPSLRSAWVLPPKVGEASAGIEVDAFTLDKNTTTDIAQIDGRFSEVSFGWRQGIGGGVEVSGALTSAGWGLGKDMILVTDGASLLNNADVTAPILTNILFGAQFEFYADGFDSPVLAAALDVKVPLRGADELATSGGVDLAPSLLATWVLDPVTVHVNAGIVFPSSQKFPRKTESLNDIAFLGVGAVYPLSDSAALAGEIQVNSTAYGFFTGLDGPVATLIVGPRLEVAEKTYLEVGAGLGMTTDSSDWLLGVELGRVFVW